MQTRPERRLAAVLAADAAGYSRLIGIDEEGTLACFKAIRANLVDGKIAKHRGRIVKTTGDGLLAEFSSVLDALRCATEAQAGMIEQNAGIPADVRIIWRIGINVGEIVIEDGDNLWRRGEHRGPPRRLGLTRGNLCLGPCAGGCRRQDPGRAIQIDGTDATAHAAMARALWMSGRHAESLAEVDRAATLDPNSATAHGAKVARGSGEGGLAKRSSPCGRRCVSVHSTRSSHYGCIL